MSDDGTGMTDASPATSPIPGVTWTRIVRHADERGSFRELWRARAFDDLDPALAGGATVTPPRFVQSNLSISAEGVLRGLHLHRRQLDHWIVASGLAFVALVDVRPMLIGAAAPIVDARLVPADTTVSIPTGVAHGFLAMEPIELVYFVTNEYDGADELGFAWDDPTAQVPWPRVPGTADGRPILSERDRQNPALRLLVERIRELEGERGS
jgi:dTDP-4-dehydrorhamnose 3,5-epimerase